MARSDAASGAQRSTKILIGAGYDIGLRDCGTAGLRDGGLIRS
jgi:hypothetical protein